MPNKFNDEILREEFVDTVHTVMIISQKEAGQIADWWLQTISKVREDERKDYEAKVVEINREQLGKWLWQNYPKGFDIPNVKDIIK